ncbi:MAG: aspartate kinase [Oscillospiraceae bacterium]|nr:aspartate kinase [Oscillospiraceae bacterium]
MLKVLKFGGSSMASAEQYAKVKAIVEEDDSRAVVVVSAAGKRNKEDHKITDLLYLCHAHMKYGVSCDSVFGMISRRYLEIRDELGLKTDLEGELERIRSDMDNGISEAALASRGEYLSALLMADYLGFDFVDAASWLRFRMDGTVDKEWSYDTLRTLAKDRHIVIPGFYGAMSDGSIRTFTRGGSDITGALAAAALEAEVYENWTDVSGILMADPRIVENPASIPRLTYSELRELSYLGAQVLHEDTIFPVAEKNIPLNIRNTNDPAHPGTIIMERFDEDGEPEDDRRFITGIAGKKDYSVVSVSKRGLSSEVGAVRKVFEIFENNGLAVEYTPNGIDTFSLVVSGAKLEKVLHNIVSQLEEKLAPDEIQVTKDLAIVAAVGRRMANRPEIPGRIFTALGREGINIRLISQGPREVNVILGVDGKDFANTVRVLYNSFVK